jgi:uncharacterized OB-fold protein
MKICPQCKTEYFAEHPRFCPKDGSTLRYKDDVPGTLSKSCPSCGTRYHADQQYCPKDGATLAMHSSTRA